tara:strand:+ start:4451 stop:5566 length:1116 start_codon:yes stop_codon:yes gene_type:complete
MKISEIKIDVIEREHEKINVFDERQTLGGKTTQGILRIITDNGIEGNAFIGEQCHNSIDRIMIIHEIIKPKILRMDVTHREWLWSQIKKISGHGLPIHSSWAPVDVALWDIAGKDVNKPIYKILGAQKTETPLYATFPPRYNSIEGFVLEAENLLNEGFDAYKIHPGNLGIDKTVKVIEKIREKVGGKMKLMLDRNHGYNLEEAIKVGEYLDANDYFWFEDPVNVNDLRAIKKLSDKIKTPINMSDSANFLLEEAANYINKNLLGMVRGTTRKLGITGLKKLCSLTESFRINCEIGLAGNSLMNMANLHVIMSVNNCTFFEYWKPESIHQWGVINEIKIGSNRKISINDLPGLGVELDQDWIEYHKVETLS